VLFINWQYEDYRIKGKVKGEKKWMISLHYQDKKSRKFSELNEKLETLM
tara:strand:- start:333 stop:479 length:147 start_codon:yes stop_codon:yes gene_type:complete